MEIDAINARMEELDKEISSRQEELAKLKRMCGGVVSDYELVGPDGGTVRLSELFGRHKDLIVIHNMGRRCSYCTLWADGFTGQYKHLTDRAAFVIVSPDAPDVQREFAASRGWAFPMYSDQAKSFTRDMGYILSHEDKEYWMPGYSTFSKDEDGTLRRIGKDFFGPGDVYCGVWHMFDLLADGANGWQPSFTYEGS